MHAGASPLIASLLAVVLAMSACGGDDGGGGDDGAAGGDGPGVTIVAGDLFFEHGDSSTKDGELDVAVSAGEVVLTVDNQGSTLHNLVIEELGDRKVAEASGGGTGSGTVTLEAGTYTFYCDVPGHRGAGMEGTITAG